MTNSSSQNQAAATNGASLEDCHTNFFAITDLCGIKWSRYSPLEPVTPPVEVSDDPVLGAYSRCLDSDVLCVWRRAPGVARAPLLDQKKELWIFWYGELPDISGLVGLDLNEDEQGSWENGLTYECRSLLFKALHNRIERYLLSRGFVRLGKWLVQPRSPLAPLNQVLGFHLSTTFSFFVHGESTVCASVEVRKHPPVYWLTPSILSAMKSYGRMIPVILAPFGLAGTLEGEIMPTSVDDDRDTKKLWEEWNKYYPVEALNAYRCCSMPSLTGCTCAAGNCGTCACCERAPTRDSSIFGTPPKSEAPQVCSCVEARRKGPSLPNMVSVVVGRTKMKYPSAYVLVVDENDDGEALQIGKDVAERRSRDKRFVPSEFRPLRRRPRNRPFGNRQSRRIPKFRYLVGLESVVLSECTLANDEVFAITPDSSMPMPVEEDTKDESGDVVGRWDFTDSMCSGCKIPCSCISTRNGSNSHVIPLRPLNANAPDSHKKRWSGLRPFHRRFYGDMLQQLDDVIKVCNQRRRSSTPSLNQANCDTKPAVLQVQTTSPSYSVGPSPLPTPHSMMSQPDSVPDPAAAAAANNLPGAEQQNCFTASSFPNQPPPSYGESREMTDGGFKTIKYENPGSAIDGNADLSDLMNSQLAGTSSTPTSEASKSTTWRPELMAKTVQESTEAGPIVKPKLEISEHELLTIMDREDSSRTKTLYDFSTIDAWSNHPVSEAPQKEAFRMEIANPFASLLEMDDAMMGSPAGSNAGSNANLEAARKLFSSDPYEFDENPGSNGSPLLDSLRKKEDGVKEENLLGQFAPNQVPTTLPSLVQPKAERSLTDCQLFSSKDLIAHMEDLNEIFEEEDREADMDAAMAEVPTPPGSNRPEDEKSQKPWSSSLSSSLQSGGTSGCTPAMFLGHAELANMFPTPPSHEPLQPMQSPCPEASNSYGLPVNVSNSNDCDMSLVKVERDEDEGYVGGMDTFDGQLSPETIPDPSNPFRRFISELTPIFEPYPTICYVGSSKYMPLTNMPSQINPLPAIVHTLIYRPSSGSSDPSNGNNSGNSNTGRGGGSGPETPADVKPSPLPVLPSQGDEVSQPMDQSHHPPSQSNLGSVQIPTPFVPESHQTGHSLVANMILADSAMNVFRDHNFESCNLCVCSEVPNSVGNIKGLDGQLYLPERALRHLARDFGELEVSRCSCGFSAVVNRRKAYKSGLFYEDECEITGVRTDKPLYCCPPSCLTTWLASRSSVEIKEHIDDVPDAIFSILTTQWNTIGGTTLTLLGKASLLRRWRCEGQNCPQKDPRVQNLLEYWDAVEITTNALNSSVPGRRKVEPVDIDVDSEVDVTSSGLHLWSFMHPTSNATSKEIIQAMRILQPLLQEAIQKKKTPGTRDATYQVLGPLTWRQFHRMAGRGTEDQCEPQPIPYVVVGHDKDWISVSPLAISVWENLLLEPYGRRRDIAYIVVAPDDNYVMTRVLNFFKELSSTYETCRLGRHSPVTKKLRDGIIGVGRKEATKLLNESVDDWFSSLGDSPLARHLRLYAQVCRHYVGPYLAQQTLETILQDEKEVKVKPPVESINVAQRPVSPSAMPPPPTPDGSTNEMKPPTPKPNTGEDNKEDKMSEDPAAQHGIVFEPDEAEDQPPALVIYLIDPFTYASQEPELYRLASLALLRCFNEIKKALPENKHDICDNLYLQIVPLESIVDMSEGSVKGYRCDDGSYPQAAAHWTRPSAAPVALKNFAFSVFTQVRTVLNHTVTVKSLTGFGPAAGADTFLKNLAKEGKSNGYQILNPAYILAPVKDAKRSTGDSLMSNVPCKTGLQTPVLYLTYCLSEDQKWLLASATDEKGELMDSTVINIHVPNRSQRRKFVARKLGLEKLMNFAMGCISGSIGQWRLVIGRFGRIGHSELKSWASLLSKKSLIRWAKRFREICKQCNCLPPTSSDAPGIASVCLVSLEPDSSHRVLADQFTPDERFGQATAASTLSTPQDISCTHILVFPTSAVTRSSQVTFHDQHINPMEEELDDDFFNQLNEDGMGNFAELLELEGFDPSVGDMLGGGNGPGSPSSGSPKGMSFENNDGSDFGVSMGFGMNGLGSNQADSRNAMDSHQQKSPRVHSLMTEAGEEVGVVLQQPLALGYLVSTAPPGVLPNWFWAQCPHMKDETPTFLTAALHLHTYVDPSSQSGQQTDEFSLVQNQNSSQPPRQHPLDSDKTTDVLRYVLEGYNSLSWLAIDPARNDRRSCLPIHMQVLANMYNTMAALV